MKKIEEHKDVEGLIKVLQDVRWVHRWKTAKALGDTRDTRAVDPLIQALNDTDKYIFGQTQQRLLER